MDFRINLFMFSEEINNLFKETKISFQKTLDWFSREIFSLRSSRVTPDLVKDIKIDYFGTKVSLKEIASLSLMDNRTISIEPWDKTLIPEIEKALHASSLGGNIRSEKERVIFSISILSQEDKEKLVKVLKRKSEEGREILRHARDKTWHKIQEMERKGEISEDEKFKGKEELQEIFDEFEEKIEELEKNKEKEIML